MTSAFTVRPARIDDAAAIALVHATSWRETYRGTLVSDSVLDAPTFLPDRELFWTRALTEERWAHMRVAVSVHQGEITGIAMSGPSDPDAASQHLFVLYALARHHGDGSGTALLHAVTRHDEDTTLWVGDPNPRAQAFYRKHGFVPDGTVKVEDGIREIRMLRAAGAPGTSA
ncbi:GNAT family N-acetyltransferase [Pseudoclavibacter helvolus]|uniref:GNAT family N-acetyltransferase n=1 Tax=Pseudoclavibacter helvolus TaxID=255205 RepID=UPI0024AE042F|nr:GNAT family N-acetyltransferase [Pseudoclavibacter helvolus]